MSNKEAYDPAEHPYPKAIYRPTNDNGAWESDTVADKDEEAAKLKAGWYLTIQECAAPGAYKKSQEAWTAAMKAEAKGDAGAKK